MRLKKICIFSKYGEWHEESFLRIYQYLPKLIENNIRADIFPLYSEKVQRNVNLLNEPYTGNFIAYTNRIYNLLTKTNYTHYWIDGETLPGILFHLESYLLPLEKKIILDLGDSVYFKYEKSKKFLESYFLKDKIPGLIQRADQVICRNSSIYSYASKFTSGNLHLIYPSINLKKFNPISRMEEDGDRELVLGFLGTHYSSNFLNKIQNVLKELGRYYPLRLVILNGNTNLDFPIKYTHINVSPKEEIAELSQIDVGIFPFPNSLREVGNLNIDILKMMALAIPVVATNLGGAVDYIESGYNGYLCNSDDDWYIYLRLLLDEKELIKNLGENARKTVEEEFEFDLAYKKLTSVFD